nr:MAG TPA: hypothetical protein [Herelleviridae sp.]
MNLIGNINAIPFRRFRGGGGVAPFPSIPGMIARYSALGLTNEQMAENPVWKDLTGNGLDLQMKNFAWSEMSGVGGYSDNFSSASWKKPSDRSDITWTSSSFNITRVMNTGVQMYYQAAWEESESVIPEKRIIVKGLEDGQVLRYMNVGNRIIEISQDGIYTIPSFIFKGVSSYYGYSLAKKQESCNVTVEQLPLYPGALVFDGVDDYGTCDNFPILTKEKGYTVVALRQWISMGEGISGLVSNVKNWFNDGAFVLEYNSNGATNKFVNRPVSFGNVNIEMDLPNNFTYQTSKSYKGVPITTGSFKGTNSLFVGKLNNIIGNCSNVAIWELVFLDHDATEEELTKIKDYFVKTYPWLFPDQAWTVTGKTNEDEDRATIANITGNGNDLVLSNFGFAEGSGYNEEGEYAGYLVTDGVDDKITSSAFKIGKDFTVVGEWKFLKEDVIKLSGFVKYDAFIFYNYSYSNKINIYIHSPQGTAFNNVDTIKAVTSEGQVYFDFNSIEEVKPGDLADKGYVMDIGYKGSNHTKLALKNFAIYPTVLSKDDCIKAYNYLQTLKAK